MRAAARIVALSALSALAALAVTPACSKTPVQEAPPPAPPAPTASAPPVDHLAKDELIEGSEKALGIPLPRRVRVTGAFVDVVYVTGESMKLDPLVAFFKARVRDGSFTKGERTATFDNVKAPGHPGVELRVHIELNAMGTLRLEVRDVTRPPPANLPDEEARWRAVGMTKDGKLLNPNRLE